jgi:pimeloyl-ACP methyl ester carboxylesterase
MEWRHLLQTETGMKLQQAIVVCVDLPGYGGSDSLEQYGPDEVLEALAEFVIAMREMYLDDGTETVAHDEQKTYIVAHDWGCVLAFRLASEASSLADRYILMNGPHPELTLANKDRIVNSALKIFKQFQQSPLQNRGCFSKALHTIRPLAYQLLLFGYIAVFHLPPFMVKYLGTGGNFAFLRGAHQAAYGKHKAEYKVQECMACTLGPSLEECKTQTPGPTPETYGKTVAVRAESPGTAFMHQTSYYRDGAAFCHWNKSLQTIADLHSIELNNVHSSLLRRRSSSASSSLFDSHYKGSLRAPATILWGQKDQACTQTICLDGIGDYLARDSEVVILPKTGHWTPVEKESREALAKVLEWYVVQGNVVGDVGGMVKEVYSGASVMVRK